VTNVTAWLRMFRPAIQRQFDNLPEADVELIDLLRAADQRHAHESDPGERGERNARREAARQHDAGKNSRTAD
jgi:hypothetical protein